MISLEPAACVIVVVDVQSPMCESWSLAAKLLIVTSVFLYFSFFFSCCLLNKGRSSSDVDRFPRGIQNS